MLFNSMYFYVLQLFKVLIDFSYVIDRWKYLSIHHWINFLEIGFILYFWVVKKGWNHPNCNCKSMQEDARNYYHESPFLIKTSPISKKDEEGQAFTGVDYHPPNFDYISPNTCHLLLFLVDMGLEPNFLCVFWIILAELTRWRKMKMVKMVT